MPIISQIAIPFIWFFHAIAELFRIVSNGCYWVYMKLMGVSVWINDLTESDYWPKE